MASVEVVRDQWKHYLWTCPTYGTQKDREPEYDIALQVMRKGNYSDRDLVVDVGAGDCGLDVYLRRCGFGGQYLPIDGSIQGIDLNHWEPEHEAEWIICLEVLEHLRKPEYLARRMIRSATKGVVFSTPNKDVVDVLAVDPTHVTPLGPLDFEDWGLDIATVNMNPGRGEGDTMFGWRIK